MGYTHYWYREKEIEQSAFNSILVDFKKVLPAIEEAGVQLAGGDGEGEPELTPERIVFNGKHKCGHRKDEEVSIPWPAKNAGGIANNWKEDAKAGHWFAGALLSKRTCDGSCDYETVVFPRMMVKAFPSEDNPGLFFECCKTAFRPYDLAVIVLLIIAKHHLKDRIIVSSDGEDEHWTDGKVFCAVYLGYGSDSGFDKDGHLKEGESDNA